MACRLNYRLDSSCRKDTRHVQPTPRDCTQFSSPPRSQSRHQPAPRTVFSYGIRRIRAAATTGSTTTVTNEASKTAGDDARDRRPSDYSRHDEYRKADRGDRRVDARIFRDGFVAGYNDGYRRYARNDRDGWRGGLRRPTSAAGRRVATAVSARRRAKTAIATAMRRAATMRETVTATIRSAPRGIARAITTTTAATGRATTTSVTTGRRSCRGTNRAIGRAADGKRAAAAGPHSRR